jgi:hypothetical protein
MPSHLHSLLPRQQEEWSFSISRPWPHLPEENCASFIIQCNGCDAEATEHHVRCVHTLFQRGLLVVDGMTTRAI